MFILFVRGMSELLSIASSKAPHGAYKTPEPGGFVPEFGCPASDNPAKRGSAGGKDAHAALEECRKTGGRVAPGVGRPWFSVRSFPIWSRKLWSNSRIDSCGLRSVTASALGLAYWTEFVHIFVERRCLGELPHAKAPRPPRQKEQQLRFTTETQRTPRRAFRTKAVADLCVHVALWSIAVVVLALFAFPCAFA